MILTRASLLTTNCLICSQVGQHSCLCFKPEFHGQCIGTAGSKQAGLHRLMAQDFLLPVATTSLCLLLPWPKKLRQARLQTTGACMLERSRTCARWHVAVPIFLARVVCSPCVGICQSCMCCTALFGEGRGRTVLETDRSQRCMHSPPG